MFFKSDKKNQDQVRGFSHLGENCRFDGEIDSKGEIEIAGKIKGNVKAKKLRILETGIVKGIVQAEDVEVLGHMVGNIDSKNIYIGNKGVVRGNLHFENNLTVLEGADISGHVQKNKKDKVKRSDTDKVKYLEHNKIAS
jgi:cytoskeletal protein CcmA (bactofilin family)